MEYIFTNLPQYIRVTSRTEFSSSVVHSGSVLLFSEDGTSLTAKLPDGSFVTVGGSGSGTDVSDTTAEAGNVQSGYYFYNSAGIRTEGTLTVSGGIDVSDTTATAAMVLSGAVFHDSAGAVTTGTIPTVSAAIESGAVVVPSGYIPTAQSFPVSSGIDVSSTTAEATDVLSGKIFYDSGGTQTTGTIPTVSASVSGGSVIVPSGYIPTSQSFPISSGGTGGSSTDFYKCASVTSGGSTWTGYLAVLSGGSYSFASSATSGLSYGGGFTPSVGVTYADGALVRADLYQGWEAPAGAVFYASLSVSSASAETGQAFTVTGSPVYATYLGIPCAQFSGSDVIEAASSNIPYSESPLSVSLWLNIAGNPADDSGVFAIGSDSEYGASLAMVYNSSGISLSGHGPGYGWDTTAPVTFDGSWKHVVVVFGQGSSGSRPASVYVGGSVTSGTFAYNTSAYETYTPQFFLGSYWGNAAYIPNLTGRIAAVRVYNYALTPAEIATLAAEFTPSAS